MSNPWTRLFLTATVAATALTGCVAGTTRMRTTGHVYATGSVNVGAPGTVYVSTLPPATVVESIPPQPYYGWVWLDGYWNWDSVQWVWINGHWEAPRPNYVYIAPTYDYYNGNYVYVAGYWESSNNVPRGYEVRDHRDGYRPPTYVRPGSSYPSSGHAQQIPVNPISGRPMTPSGSNNGSNYQPQPIPVTPVNGGGGGTASGGGTYQPQPIPVNPMTPSNPSRPQPGYVPTYPTQPTPVQPVQPVPVQPVPGQGQPVRPVTPYVPAQPVGNGQQPQRPTPYVPAQPVRPAGPGSGAAVNPNTTGQGQKHYSHSLQPPATVKQAQPAQQPAPKPPTPTRKKKPE